MIKFTLSLLDFDDADGVQSSPSIIVQPSHVDEPEVDEYVHSEDAASGRAMCFKRLPAPGVAEPMFGLAFYMRMRRFDEAAGREVVEQVGKNFISIYELMENPNMSVEMINMFDGGGEDVAKAHVLLQHIECTYKPHGSYDAFKHRVLSTATRCNEINQRSVDFFMGRCGYTPRDKRSEHDACVYESGSYPVRNMPVNAFLYSKFVSRKHSPVALANILQSELDGEGMPREWFCAQILDVINERDPIGDQGVLALQVCISALCVCTRLFAYTSDTARFSGGKKIDGDSYDLALVNRAGDCDDLGISIYMVAKLIANLPASMVATDRRLRAWQRALGWYDFYSAFGGVTSAAVGEEEVGDQAPEFGNHFWINALRRMTVKPNAFVKSLPHAWVLEGTGHISPACEPLFMRLSSKDRRDRFHRHQFNETLLFRSAVGSIAAPGIAVGPMEPFDVTCVDKKLMYTPSFYREPVGVVSEGVNGICVYSSKKSPRQFGTTINAVIQPWHENDLCLVSVHRRVLTREDTQIFEEDACMRIGAPPFVSSSAFEARCAEMQERFRRELGERSSDVVLSPKEMALVRCSFAPERWEAFKKAFVDQDYARVFVGVYGIREAYYRSEVLAGDDLVLVQCVVGVPHDDRRFVADWTAWESATLYKD